MKICYDYFKKANGTSFAALADEYATDIFVGLFYLHLKYMPLHSGVFV